MLKVYNSQIPIFLWRSLMARIAGINIPTNKRVEIALTYIHGIGLRSSKKICELANIKDQTRVNNLTEGELSKIRDIIDKDY